MNAHQRRVAKRAKKSPLSIKLYPHQIAMMEHMRQLFKDHPIATMQLPVHAGVKLESVAYDLETQSENRLLRPRTQQEPILIHTFRAGDFEQNVLRLTRSKMRLKIGNNPTEFRFPKASDFEFKYVDPKEFKIPFEDESAEKEVKT